MHEFDLDQTGWGGEFTDDLGLGFRLTLKRRRIPTMGAITPIRTYCPKLPK